MYASTSSRLSGLSCARNRNALVELPHLRGRKDIEQVQLTRRGLSAGSFDSFVSRFEMMRICSRTCGDEMLRLVDDEHRAAVNGHQRQQEFVQRY
jgi:hypothetical protein